MYVHPDKELKDNLFNYYQQELTDRRIRKDDYIKQEKMSDKVYIDQIKRSNEEERMRKEMEKAKRVNENMQDYGQLMMKKDEQRRQKFGKIEENIMNNNNNNQNINYNNNNNNYGNYPNNPNMDLNPRFKNQNMKVDNLNYIMHPDNSVGVRQLNEMERNKKFESQKYYKNMLDSQMSIPSMSGMQKKGYVNPSGNMISNPCN